MMINASSKPSPNRPPNRPRAPRPIKSVSARQLTRTIKSVNMAIKIAEQNPDSQIAQWKVKALRSELDDILVMPTGPCQTRCARKLEDTATLYINLSSKFL